MIYHVSNSGRPISKRTSEELRSLTLTSMSASEAGTQTAKPEVETEIHFEKVNPNDLKLRINPFGSQHSLDRLIFDGFELPSIPIPSGTRSRTLSGSAPSGNFPNLQNIRRLDAETCKKEGIFFDDLDHSDAGTPTHDELKEEQGNPDETVSVSDDALDTEDIVRDILEGIVNKIVWSEEETFGESSTKTSEGHGSPDTLNAEDLFSALDGKISEVDSPCESDVDGLKDQREQEEIPSVHPLHNHILLYTRKYDSQRTLYSLSCLKSILIANPRLVTCSVSTSSVSNANTPHLAQLQHLLTRHRRSVFGKNFFSEVPGDMQGMFRSAMFVEILISVCLYYIRSYYPNLMMSKLTESELNGNKEVQILSCEILMLLLSELVNVARESGKGFSTYIHDLLTRCKVQKTLLHCVLASVYNARVRTGSQEDVNNFTDALISFNEENMDINTNETFQIKLLHLLLVVIVLEDEIQKSRTDEVSPPLPSEWDKIKLNFQPSLSTVRFVQSRPIIYQGMLLSAILGALKQQHLTNMHRHWVAMVTSTMPYFRKALSHVVITVINQLCRNVELLAQMYELGDIYKT